MASSKREDAQQGWTGFPTALKAQSNTRVCSQSFTQIGLYNGGAKEVRARVAAVYPREPMSDDSDCECGICVNALQDAAMPCTETLRSASATMVNSGDACL